MSTEEFWWEFDSHAKEAEGLKQYKKDAGGFSAAEWEDARRRHTEKMNGRTK